MEELRPRATMGTMIESRWRLWPSLGEKSMEGMENVCKILGHHWDVSWYQWSRLVLMRPNYCLSSLEMFDLPAGGLEFKMKHEL
jgi:hypothetical protein